MIKIISKFIHFLLMVNFKTVNIMGTFGAYTKMASVNNLYIKTMNLWNLYERLIYAIFLTYYYIFINYYIYCL